MPRPASSPTREESKQITRQRLLDAGLRVLGKSGYDGLTTGRIAKAAGVAQPTFYVHFKDKDDLLQCMAQDYSSRLRTALTEARSHIELSGSDDPIRGTFRLPLQAIAEHADLLRVLAGEIYRDSPMGHTARELMTEMRRDLAGDLRRLGMRVDSEVDEREVELIADGMIQLTFGYGLAYAEDRYPDLEELVDLLTRNATLILADYMERKQP